MRVLRNILSRDHPFPNQENRDLFNKHIWPFYIEKEWEFVDDIKDADIIPLFFNFNPINTEILNRLTARQTVLILSIFHIDETYEEHFYLKYLKQYRDIFPNCFIVHKNRAIKDVDGLIYYDCMFNRHKLYYHDYHKIEQLLNSFPVGGRDILWTAGAKKEMYSIPVGKANPNNCRAYLSPGLVYQGMFIHRMRYRAGLKDYLRKHYENKGYINSPENNFLPNNPDPGVIRIIQRPDGGGGYWYPIADHHYQETYVSIYVETLTVSGYDTRCITEKTFDPLIKGHFIMPFAYSGFIDDVKSYGFKLPDFINYSYDAIKDNDKRFYVFLQTIDDLFRHVMDFRKEYDENLSIIEHNRQVFIDRPYDSLYKKVSDGMSKLPQISPISAL